MVGQSGCSGTSTCGASLHESLGQLEAAGQPKLLGAGTPLRAGRVTNAVAFQSGLHVRGFAKTEGEKGYFFRS